jgi:hypothetical protein
MKIFSLIEKGIWRKTGGGGGRLSVIMVTEAFQLCLALALVPNTYKFINIKAAIK